MLFQEAYAQGRKQAGRHVVVWRRAGEDASRRVGVVASRKVGNSVKRSRAKRRMRELYRLHQHLLGTEDDLVLVARHTLPEAEWGELREDFLRTLGRAGCLLEPLP